MATRFVFPRGPCKFIRLSVDMMGHFSSTMTTAGTDVIGPLPLRVGTGEAKGAAATLTISFRHN